MPSDPQQLFDELRQQTNSARNEVVFKEPWEGQAFALAVSLHARGVFTWSEWAASLAQVIREAGADDDGSEYYKHWVTALERITVNRGLLDDASLSERRRQWAHAIEHTPHGQPISLSKT
jgi:nitrile hydratase accessory protein